MKKQQYFIHKILGLLLVFIAINFSCNSKLENPNELRLPSVFSDNMVLQQNFDTAFWGESKPNEIITVRGSWGKEAAVQSNEKGDWELKLSTPRAGGPYMVTIQTPNKSILLNDVMIGEVWLSSGQSNMEWRMNQCINCIDNQDEEISKVNNNEIRMFTVPLDLSGELIKKSKWLVANPENAGDIDFPGVYNGLGVYVLDDPSQMDFKAPKGLYGHGGYQSTEFFIDPKNKIYGVFLNRTLTKYNHRYNFIKSVYDSF
ncbi:beta-lactamase family protein [Flavobacteriaceae bacterium]|nr:beta-lactamase family protein [Flavobacteriaceae bacterium]